MFPSCSTSVIDTEPNQPGNTQNGQDLTLSFKIMQNSYTRAETEDDAKVSSLTLAFYKISNSTTTYLYSLKTTSNGNPGEFSVNLSLDKEVPNAVVALANLSDDSFKVNDALSDDMVTKDLQSDGGLIMSSARYYNTDSETNDCIKYTSISSNNLYNNEPVQIYLDRVAAKVNVTLAENATLATMTGYNTKDELHEFNLKLLNWQVIATDKSSYLMKNCGASYSDISLGNNGDGSSSWQWNSPANHSFSWAHSVNWDVTIFPTPGEESESSITNHMKFSNIQNEYGSSALYHETTRKSSLFNTPNALPSVLLVGQYTLLKDSSKPQTLFRRGNLILTQDEMYTFIAKINVAEKLLYYKNGTSIPALWGTANINELFTKEGLIFSPATSNEATYMPNMVSVQINPDKIKDFSILSTNDETSIYITEQRMQQINERLLERVGVWEIYEDGKCFFYFPIEHSGKQFDSNGTKTGSYGLVRNHCYNITVKNISGIGQGVKNDAFAGCWPTQEFTTGVNYNVTVNKWTNVNQEIE